ncbi:DUF3180 domain-containing protein [Streptomonospora nanhaiensis]|uniref:DUF3180 domain-containing protein n=1 Tax=Streptomonospora nanhaiensis TaxID=1323731 RepID=A0A853BPT6_9ACTN|nr:hypothetical protein [Streptomonospora nanhaiensis]
MYHDDDRRAAGGHWHAMHGGAWEPGEPGPEDPGRGGAAREPGDGGGRVRPTGWRMPVVVIVLSALAGYLLVDRFYGDIPLLPWTAIPTLGLLAVGEGITAVHTRRRIRRVPGTEPMEPLSAARLVALAKASAVFASVVIGAFGGMLVVLADRLTAADVRADAFTAAGTLASGVLLLAAALFLEHACRVPGEGQPGGPRT